MRVLVVLALFILASVSSANDGARFIEEKVKIDRQIKNTSCSQMKIDLVKLAENTEALKYLERGSLQADLSLYALKAAIKKAASCIR
jgi:hypothetical protein